LRCEALHGGLSQDQRDRVMKRFRAKKTDLLVATDVAARGLDVQHVSHVVNFDVPSDAETYVHRIGRTGRAGREGMAITLAEPREHRWLRNLERLTGQPIAVEAVPTVNDLRARRLELTRTTLREAILEAQEQGGTEAGHEVVASLAEEFDIFDIAAAAVRLLDAGRQVADEPDIPAPLLRPERPTGDRTAARERASGTARERASGAAGRVASRAPARGASRDGDGARSAAPARAKPKARGGAVVKLFVGGGRKAKIRPGDLVGAIVNETGVPAADIGAIVVSDRHCTVEVPAGEADRIVAALSATSIKGRRVPVRRDKIS
jgi:ATP-dependent RNA helicase DeaD